MIWCSYCAKKITRPDYVDGKICCSLCGRVLDEDSFCDEPTFVKNAGGQGEDDVTKLISIDEDSFSNEPTFVKNVGEQSQLAGNIVRTIQNHYSVSRERILKEASDGIESIIYALGIDGGDSIARPALAFYTIAYEMNFTRGRRKEQVEAACVYITCRVNKKPFLLIDFSEHLRINVYVLGAVYLQLCKLLYLGEHDFVQKPVDPSLFIHRFTDRLFGERKPSVSKTALHIIASMKRDWMQTGRKPSGLCGAALYISALSHGLSVSKSDVIKVVHICEATLTKRLIEFENTESGSLTIEEFNVKADEFEKEVNLNKQPFSAMSQVSGKGELLCEHKGSGLSAFAHGLCESCYRDFMQLSGGLDGGSEPPAFQRAERERILASQNACETNSGGQENLQFNEAEPAGANSVHPSPKDTQHNNFHEAGSLRPSNSNESDNFSDIDDVEVSGYLHSEEEKHLKTIIWEEMNKEYLEEQAAKEAARKAYEANFENCSEELQAAQKLSAAVAASLAKSRKEKQEKRAAELRNQTPAQTAAEATKQMLSRKRLASKINLDVLDKLFDQSEIPENNSKRSRSMSPVPEESTLDGKQSPRLEDNNAEEDVTEEAGYDDEYDFDDEF